MCKTDYFMVFVCYLVPPLDDRDSREDAGGLSREYVLRIHSVS